MPSTHVTQEEIIANRAKLAERFGNTSRIAGNQRRRKQANHRSVVSEDKKLAATLKHCGAQPIPGIEEVNFFNGDGTITHFNAPRVQVAPACNTYAVSGKPEVKNIQEMLPGILSQLGTSFFNPETMHNHAHDAPASNTEDEIPDLVENFEETSKN